MNLRIKAYVHFNSSIKRCGWHFAVTLLAGFVSLSWYALEKIVSYCNITHLISYTPFSAYNTDTLANTDTSTLHSKIVSLQRSISHLCAPCSTLHSVACRHAEPWGSGPAVPAPALGHPANALRPLGPVPTSCSAPAHSCLWLLLWSKSICCFVFLFLCSLCFF